jgi:hypothetical protein
MTAISFSIPSAPSRAPASTDTGDRYRPNGIVGRLFGRRWPDHAGLTYARQPADRVDKCQAIVFRDNAKITPGDYWEQALPCSVEQTRSASGAKIKEGETTNDLYAFLTTEPNAEVGAIHPKAKPVILTTPDEVETWMTAPPDEALKLQRPLPDGSLRIVARGAKEDLAETAG